jgi:hypothetical protein
MGIVINEVAMGHVFSKYFSFIRFEVFMVVNMKNGVFWDVTLWLL